MPHSPPLDEQTLEILRRNESRYLRALEIYYSKFHEKDGPTFNAAARNAGVNPAYLVDYMFFRKEYRLGMPGDNEDAAEFLKNLHRLKQDLAL